MARYADREKATKLRLEGKSYSEIKATLGISKSTLSGWLQAYPLSPEKIRELRDLNPRRIEKYRNTRARQRESRLQLSLKEASKDIGVMSKRDLLMGGFFLYWAEGSKTENSSVELTNTNPAMLRYFVKWLKTLGLPEERLRIRIQLYADMHINTQLKYWSKELAIPLKQFSKPYIKKSNRTGITYKGSFDQGTCSVIAGDQKTARYIKMGVRRLMEIYTPSAIVN